MEGFSRYIDFSKPFPSSTCLSSNPALKYLSYWASFLTFCEWQWLKTLFRGLLHINAARKAVVHLMRWWQLFPKIFLYPYHLLTHLKSIFIIGISWKSTQVNRMLAWLTFVRSEENDPLGPRPSTLSWQDYRLWDLPSHFLLLGRIPISKWGLRPNIKVQAFAPTVIVSWLINWMIWSVGRKP